MTEAERKYREAAEELEAVKAENQRFVVQHLREMLESALAKRDQEQAREWIQLAVRHGAPIEEHHDLHGRLMLLLAMPGQEKRGRPADDRTEIRERMLCYACMAKAALMGWSFSRTWSEHIGRSRPAKPEEELWRAAGIVSDLARAGQKEAVYAANTFGISTLELEDVAEKYRPNYEGRPSKGGNLG